MKGIKGHFSILRDFFRNGFGSAVKITAAAFLLLVIAGYLAGLLFPDLTQNYIDHMTEYLAGLDLMDETGQLSPAALLGNNIYACLLSVLYGCIPLVYFTAYPLGSNAALMGLFASYYQRHNMSLALYAVAVLPHGIFEIPAMILSFALGLFLCRQFTARLRKQGNIPLKKLFERISRVFFTLVVPLLAVAAVAEAYLTPYILSYFM